MRERWSPTIGANVESGGVRFRVWAPGADAMCVTVHCPGETVHAMTPEAGGYHSLLVPGIGAGARYKYRIGEATYPDPASRCQPEGVHGPSEVCDPAAFVWTDAGWSGVSIEDLVIYELHVGTFTTVGTFDAAIARLDEIAELGITAIEVMPVATASGRRNWGYDGTQLFAPTTNYGGPEAFKRFVDAAHARGIGVILDVVYNHFGPDGNYLPAITGGRFFTDRHKTPWGDAIDYGNDAVRDFVRQNALYWAHEFHVDGLRLDATHAILDDSATHIIAEIAADLHALPRPRLVIAEDDRNERRLVLPRTQGGFGLDGVWADDLHHSLRRMSAGDSEGYFASYRGTADEVAVTLTKGWLYEGQYAEHHQASRGTPAFGLPSCAFVHCIQNHDQVGNRPLGDRLGHGIDAAAYRALSALLLLSPYTPMLWMGQEWNASSPFQFFTDFPEELGKLVTKGRREEFRHFSVFSDEEKRSEIPDPQAESTFHRSKLCWTERGDPAHAAVLALYRELLRLRREEPSLRERRRGYFRAGVVGEDAVALRRSSSGGATLLLIFSPRSALRHRLDLSALTQLPDGMHWDCVLATEDCRFGGTGEWGRLDAHRGILELSGAGAVLLRAERAW